MISTPPPTPRGNDPVENEQPSAPTSTSRPTVPSPRLTPTLPAAHPTLPKQTSGSFARIPGPYAAVHASGRVDRARHDIRSPALPWNDARAAARDGVQAGCGALPRTPEDTKCAAPCARTTSRHYHPTPARRRSRPQAPWLRMATTQVARTSRVKGHCWRVRFAAAVAPAQWHCRLADGDQRRAGRVRGLGNLDYIAGCGDGVHNRAVTRGADGAGRKRPRGTPVRLQPVVHEPHVCAYQALARAERAGTTDDAGGGGRGRLARVCCWTNILSRTGTYDGASVNAYLSGHVQIIFHIEMVPKTVPVFSPDVLLLGVPHHGSRVPCQGSSGCSFSRRLRNDRTCPFFVLKPYFRLR